MEFTFKVRCEHGTHTVSPFLETPDIHQYKVQNHKFQFDLASEQTVKSLWWQRKPLILYHMSYILYHMIHSSSRSKGAAQEYGQYKEIVEDADFEALDWKLRGCKVSVAQLMLLLIATASSQISKSLRNLFSQL